MSSVEPTHKMPRYKRTREQPENPFVSLVADQEIAIIPSFTLESGVELKNVPVAYTTRGTLSANGDNCMVICHALTGSADVSDWWGPLIGPGCAFDTSRFFVVCMNSMGSPYGSASPVTCKDGDPSRERYGPEFPLTTIRDDVRLHKLLLDDLGVRQIAAAIGGSLGGMFVLEWAYFGKKYVRCIVAIATSARHSAWGISWGESQRQSIYADPKYEDGYYPLSDPPVTGLGAARMSALLTYRSRNSFEARFGRNAPNPSQRQWIRERPAPTSVAEANFNIHNDGHHVKLASRHGSSTNVTTLNRAGSFNGGGAGGSNQVNGAATGPGPNSLAQDTTKMPTSTYYSAQSYLRYQAKRFVERFDSNCYIAMTRKLDTHDVSWGRANTVAEALAMIEQPTLVLGIESDGLFTFAEQQEIAEHIRDARLERIDSSEGHDAFLLQFQQVSNYISNFIREVLPDIMTVEGAAPVQQVVKEVTKSSTFGEAEVEDITAW